MLNDIYAMYYSLYGEDLDEDEVMSTYADALAMYSDALEAAIR